MGVYQARGPRACAFLEVAPTGGGQERFGIGIDGNIVTASIRALVGAAARLAENTPHIVVNQGMRDYRTCEVS